MPSEISLSPLGDLVLSGFAGGPDLTLASDPVAAIAQLRRILRARQGYRESDPILGTACQPLARELSARWRADPEAQAKAAEAARIAALSRLSAPLDDIVAELLRD